MVKHKELEKNLRILIQSLPDRQTTNTRPDKLSENSISGGYTTDGKHNGGSYNMRESIASDSYSNIGSSKEAHKKIDNIVRYNIINDANYDRQYSMKYNADNSTSDMTRYGSQNSDSDSDSDPDSIKSGITERTVSTDRMMAQQRNDRARKQRERLHRDSSKTAPEPPIVREMG